jgi:diguanylate cyclase (GGDEF)-like protein
MFAPRKLASLLLGDDPKTHRMLAYWAATCVLYIVFFVLIVIQVAHGRAERWALDVMWPIALVSMMSGYAMIRASKRLSITPASATMLQALLAIICDVFAYAICGQVRGAVMMIMLVVLVFCAFSLRPRQTLALCLTADALLAATMHYLVGRDPASFPLEIEAAHFAIATICLLAVGLVTGEMSKLRARLTRQKHELQAAVDTIRDLATIDELTSLANRRHMNQVLAAAERREPQADERICLALLDIDFFKHINDRYGHAAGDAVLREFAAAARAELRAGDLLARWGGEEFLLMLPHTSRPEAVQVLARMAQRAAAIDVPGVAQQLRITFSAGLVERAGAEPFAETIIRADTAMYRAKSTGRDRSIVA